MPAPSSPSIAGSATLTTKASSVTTKNPSSATASDRRAPALACSPPDCPSEGPNEPSSARARGRSCIASITVPRPPSPHELDAHGAGLERAEAVEAAHDGADRDHLVVEGGVPARGVVEEAEVAPGDEADEVAVGRRAAGGALGVQPAREVADLLHPVE